MANTLSSYLDELGKKYPNATFVIDDDDDDSVVFYEGPLAGAKGMEYLQWNPVKKINETGAPNRIRIVIAEKA